MTPFSVLRRKIRSRGSTYTIRRKTTTTDAGETTTSYSDDHDETLYCYNQSKRTVQTDYGEDVRGSLDAYALDDADVVNDDRITYGSGVYEAQSVVPQPSESDVELYELTFVRTDH